MGGLQYNHISIDGHLRPTSKHVNVNNSEYDQFRNISSNNHFSNQAAIMKVQSQSQISVSDKIDDFFAELSKQVKPTSVCLFYLLIRWLLTDKLDKSPVCLTKLIIKGITILHYFPVLDSNCLPCS